MKRRTIFVTAWAAMLVACIALWVYVIGEGVRTFTP